MEQPVIHDRLARLAGREILDAVTVARLAALVFLHDFGKLNTGFQHKVLDDGLFSGRRPEPRGHVAEAAAVLVSRPESRTRAAFDVRNALGLGELAAWGDSICAVLLAALAHHGRPVDLRAARNKDALYTAWRPYKGYDPAAAAADFSSRMRQWFAPAFAPGGRALPDAPAFQHGFAGLVALADWIGSQSRFVFESGRRDDYIGTARSRAVEAVAEIGLAVEARRAASSPPDFAGLFPGLSPNAMQRAVGSTPLDARLLILEAETGSGKTEAALLRYAALFKAGLVDGLYFAVPTRSAAVQLHRRVEAAMRNLFPADDPFETILAVPGYRRAGEIEGHLGPGWQVFWDDDPGEAVIARRWAAESSRQYLAAQVAVGTVDQAMLAGLMVKHAHVRAAALARSLLVIDEVHASDAYMRKVLGRVLENHLDAGGHALLMSATLGSASRARWLTGTRAAPSVEEATAAPYPALWGRGDSGPFRHAIGAGEWEKSVTVATAGELELPDLIADRALAAAHAGARVLVVRNTVDGAVSVARALEAKCGVRTPMLRVDDIATLHHGRFAAEDRRALDKAVEKALGKDAAARGLVVVGTQTLEQSLDIDADYLITDLCPIDVMLQRIGRLHRHRRTDRPAGFAEPRCVVLVPRDGLTTTARLLRFGLGPTRDGGGIYPDLRILEATRRLIEDEPVWRIPAMNRALVERATHPEALAALEDELGKAWAKIGQLVEGREIGDGQTGQYHALDWSVSFLELRFPDAEEKIRTRLGADGAVVEFDDQPTGPFGRPVSRIVLPHHLSVGLTAEDLSGVMAEPFDGGFRFHCGAKTFRYDRFGLTKA